MLISVKCMQTVMRIIKTVKTAKLTNAEDSEKRVY